MNTQDNPPVFKVIATAEASAAGIKYRVQILLDRGIDVGPNQKADHYRASFYELIESRWEWKKDAEVSLQREERAYDEAKKLLLKHIEEDLIKAAQSGSQASSECATVNLVEGYGVIWQREGLWNPFAHVT